MENNKEEDLQSNVEKNLLEGTDKDSRSYRLVFAALRSETSFQLPPHFADQVLKRHLQQEGAPLLSEYFWLAAGLASILIAGSAAVIMTDFVPDFGFLKGLARYFYVLAFGGAFILGLQWLDKKFIRKTSTFNFSS